jgi:ATP-dependent DNA helicase RecQ
MAFSGVTEARTEVGNRFHDALKRYWGYDAFRPKQEEIVQALMEGRDACVVMPTGGGKSLCYQLPAVLDEKRTAVVISPLIALMQDQVAQLQEMGIPAAFLNSSIKTDEREGVRQRAISGAYRLLYLSPELIAMDGTIHWLKKLSVSFFAIDEAHCISQWGHDFRPEYRQLKKLREIFPGCAIAALTASATQQVRHDIVEQLQLRDPVRAILSFRRDNLSYVVCECKGATQDEMLLEAVKRAGNGNVIVYAPTISRVGEVVDLLGDRGVAAVEYHGQMSGEARRENQEKWMTEEVRVLVGTIAFGLGINKANVRAVVRLGLPDSIELLYQETGRAGRDGLPANCYLFWEPKDRGLRQFFMNKIGSDQEYKAAQQRFEKIQEFIKSPECRQKHICMYFGEGGGWRGCGVCDRCAGPPAWLSLVSAASNPPRYKFRKRKRQRYPVESGTYELHSSVPVSEELQDYMREWRKNASRERKRSAVAIMHDTTLDLICAARPKTLSELRRISGMGEAKCDEYGGEILEVLRCFQEGVRASKEWHARPNDASQETLELLRQGNNFAEIAQIRGRKISTVVALIANLVETGDVAFEPTWVGAERYTRIKELAEQRGMDLLRPLKDNLPEEISYEEIRLVVADLKRKGKEGGVGRPKNAKTISSGA